MAIGERIQVDGGSEFRGELNKPVKSLVLS